MHRIERTRNNKCHTILMGSMAMSVKNIPIRLWFAHFITCFEGNTTIFLPFGVPRHIISFINFDNSNRPLNMSVLPRIVIIFHLWLNSSYCVCVCREIYYKLWFVLFTDGLILIWIFCIKLYNNPACVSHSYCWYVWCYSINFTLQLQWTQVLSVVSS